MPLAGPACQRVAAAYGSGGSALPLGRGGRTVTNISDQPLVEIRNVSKHFGSVSCLEDISTAVRAGTVTCVLGDNGAGKTTFIKIVAGVYQPDAGSLVIDGEPTVLKSPRDALDRGIATVYQDLAMVALMPIWRNFFLGSEPTKGWGPWQQLDVALAKQTCRAELRDMGIEIRDADQAVGTLSGGERQSIAIARAIHFGARLLILDEPTSALGVKQAGVVLRYMAQARDRGVGIIFITHNPHHAYPVGDRFLVLKRGRSFGDFSKSEITLDRLTQLMAGGSELDALGHELERGDVAARKAAAEIEREAEVLKIRAGEQGRPHP